MRKIVRFEIRENDLWYKIIQVEQFVTKTGEILETYCGTLLAEDGQNWLNSPDHIVALLNDGLKYRSQYKNKE